MPRKRTKAAEAEFDLQRLQSLGGSFDEIEIDAIVERHGDALVITPEIGNPRRVVRVPASAVRLGEELPAPSYASSMNGTLRRIWVKRSAPALHILAEPFEAIIGSAVPTAAMATLQARIDFRADGEGSMTYGGRTVPCLGNPELAYTKDLTVQGIVGTDKFEKKYSKEYDVWMNWAVLIMGNRGIYVHEGADNLSDNGGATAGCIHLKDAKDFYNWVTGRTRILISYPW